MDIHTLNIKYIHILVDIKTYLYKCMHVCTLYICAQIDIITHAYIHIYNISFHTYVYTHILYSYT